eukprot:6403151-Alexandrium_andersonii.AAC.1
MMTSVPSVLGAATAMVLANWSACALGGRPVSTHGAPPRPRAMTATSVHPADWSVAPISAS